MLLQTTIKGECTATETTSELVFSMIVFMCTVGTGCAEFYTACRTSLLILMSLSMVRVPIHYLGKRSGTVNINAFKTILPFSFLYAVYINTELFFTYSKCSPGVGIIQFRFRDRVKNCLIG